MVFQSFIRFAKYSLSSSSCRPEIRHHFFRSSYPYLNRHHFFKNLISNYNKGFNKSKWWFRSQRNTSNRSKPFLTISDGHYGLYYSMYNHDSERQQRQKDHEKYIKHMILKQLETSDRILGHKSLNSETFFPRNQYHHHHHHHHMVNCFMGRYRGRQNSKNSNGRSHYHRRRCPHHHGFHLKLLLIGFTAKFLISKAMVDTQINLDGIKKFSSKLFSSFAYKPFNYSFASFTRLATVTKNTTISNEKEPEPVATLYPPLSKVFTTGVVKRTFATLAQQQQQDHERQVVAEQQKQPPSQPHTTTQENITVDTFEQDFLASKVSKIVSTFETYSTPDDLNIIYPLYQAVKRNDLKLPSIDVYNIVLKSILNRSLNSELTLDSIEGKLTVLLTVYQDILAASIKPNKETYNIVVTALLKGSLQCLDIPTDNILQYNEIHGKSQEFAQICLELFTLISSQLDLQALLADLLKLLYNYPKLITPQIIEPFVNLIQMAKISDKDYYLLILELSKYFTQFDLLSKEQTYQVIESAYTKYKLFGGKGKGKGKINPFIGYKKVIVSLVNNDFIMEASQLLDEILLDYKQSLQFKYRPSKHQISNLIGSFLKAFIMKTNDLTKGYELLVKFNSVAYLPDLPVRFYNFMITKLAENENDMDAEMWSIYNRVMIRTDYQNMSTMEMVKHNGKACRDVLLSHSLEENDHEHCFQLIKEILVKEHLISDLDTLNKTFHYLYNAMLHNITHDDNNEEQGFFNQYYFGLLWQLMETQAKHYKTSTDINDFISHFVQFLTVKVPEILIHDERAINAIINYNVNLLLNSPFINRAVESFNLQTDNIYGLTLVVRELMKFDDVRFSVQLSLYKRIVEFETLVIDEFEDSENSYIELTPEMTQFLQDIKKDRDYRLIKLQQQSVVNGQHHVLSISDSEALASSTSTSTSTDIPSDLTCEIDLSYLLNLNFDKGLLKFLELYNKDTNYKFNFATWNIILNFEFLDNFNSQFEMKELLQRIWLTNCEESKKLELIKRLILYNFGNVINGIGEFIKQNKIFNDNELLITLFQTCLKLKDKVSQEIFATDDSLFQTIYESNRNTEWIVAYLNYLISVEQYEKVITIIDSRIGHFNLPESLGHLLLEADLHIEDLNKFQTDFKNLNLTPTNKLYELCLKYDLKSGELSAKQIIDKYSKFAAATAAANNNGLINLQELISFCHVLCSLQSSESITNPYRTTKFESVNILATSLLTTRNFDEMKTIIDSNEIKIEPSKLFDEMISILIELSSYNHHHENRPQLLMNKFIDTIKLCKYLRLKSVSMENFLTIIRFLTEIKSDLLTVILNRFINNNNNGHDDADDNVGSFADIVMFYFIEVDLFNYKSKLIVLKELLNSMKKLGDNFNVLKINEFCQSNGIRFS